MSENKKIKTVNGVRMIEVCLRWDGIFCNESCYGQRVDRYCCNYYTEELETENNKSKRCNTCLNDMEKIKLEKTSNKILYIKERE